MREIRPQLTPELQTHCGRTPVWRARPFSVSTFGELVEHVAKLAYANRDDLLFFRGQDKDYQSKADGTTLYPSIYREDALPARELRHRFDLLEQAARLLVEQFKFARIEGHRELRQKRYIQWSIIQHYGVAATPLLDLTHSLRVACSFAQLRSTDPTCYVYVLGLPYVTNRITINSEHDIVNIRLLSICPPAALRPYFQKVISQVRLMLHRILNQRRTWTFEIVWLQNLQYHGTRISGALGLSKSLRMRYFQKVTRF